MAHFRDHKYGEPDTPPQPVHPRAEDRWNQAVGALHVAVDRAGCIVLHTPHGTVTVTDVEELRSALRDAKDFRDETEEQW